MEWLNIDFVGVAALLTAIGSLYYAWKRTEPEKADAAATYQRIAQQSAEDVVKLREENEELRAEIKALAQRVDDLEREVNIYYHGVERLVNQLKSLDQKPVWAPPKREPTKSS